MKILLKPIDTLFFRDGKPFTMGTETWADGVSLPNPSVIYGALKTAYYSNNPDDFEKVDKNTDPATDEIEIKSIYYKYKNNNYYPLPLDFIYLKDKKKADKRNEEKENRFAVSLLNNTPSKNLSSANDLEIYTSDNEIETIDDGLIEEGEFDNYLKGVKNETTTKKTSKIVTPEPKVGIGRNNLTRTTDEGKLYRIGMNRFNNFSFGIELTKNIDFGNSYPKLGGEGKISALSIDSKELTIDKTESFEIKEKDKFRIYISTHAIFEKGWLPSWIDKKTKIGKINELEIKLISTFIGKPISIGGFDMAKKAPKPMKKAVPAGSVYYFELLKGTKEKLFETFHKKSISELGTNKQGFGISYIGVIK